MTGRVDLLLCLFGLVLLTAVLAFLEPVTLFLNTGTARQGIQDPLPPQVGKV